MWKGRTAKSESLEVQLKWALRETKKVSLGYKLQGQREIVGPRNKEKVTLIYRLDGLRGQRKGDPRNKERMNFIVRTG